LDETFERFHPIANVITAGIGSFPAVEGKQQSQITKAKCIDLRATAVPRTGYKFEDAIEITIPEANANTPCKGL
jgi:hypothetical protein